MTIPAATNHVPPSSSQQTPTGTFAWPVNPDERLKYDIAQQPENPGRSEPVSRRAPSSPQFLLTQGHVSTLVEKSDAELAQQLSAALMGQVAEELTTNRQSLTAPTLTQVPPFSSFGQAWARFNQALRAEPFATFAKAHHIDLSNFSWNPQEGTMTCMINGSPNSFTEFTPGWSQASADVAAAARELGAPSTTWFRYTGEHTPPSYLVGDFYAIARTELTRNPRAVIAALQQADTFPLWSSPTAPCHWTSRNRPCVPGKHNAA